MKPWPDIFSGRRRIFIIAGQPWVLVEFLRLSQIKFVPLHPVPKKNDMLTTMVALPSFPITNPTWIFFVVLLIILLAPLLFERLRIPQIVGMILAGLLVGPHGLNVLTTDSSFELFGQVGLYYIMFMAGLSMDTGTLKLQKARAVCFGLLSFLIPFVMGGAFVRGVLGLSVEASVLLACVMSSHTLVSYSVVSRYGLTRYEGVTLSVVATMFALVLALFVLAGLAATFEEGGGLTLWMLPVKCALYLAGLLLVYPRLIRWFFRTFSDDVLQYIFVLMLVFLSAAVSQALGLEGVLGAFLAGLVFNRYIPEAVPLMRHIDFVGNALFIPYFLIGVGMMINLKEIFMHTDVMVVVVAISAVAILTKWLAAAVAVGVFRLGRDMRWMMTGLTSGHAAGALAMLMVGSRLELSPGVPLVDDTLMGAVVMLILVSCIFSAVMTSAVSRKLSLNSVSEEEKLGEEDKILVALTDSETTANLVKLALMMRPHRSTAPLVGVRLIVDAQNNDRERSSARQLVMEAAQIAASAGVNMKKVVRSGVNMVTALVYTMKDFDASEIVIASRPENVTGHPGMLDDLTERLARQVIVTDIHRAVNTIRCIHVIVPRNAELELGFQRWLMHVSRLARQMDCRIVFHSPEAAFVLIRNFCGRHYKTIRMEWEALEDFDKVGDMGEGIHDDHLLVMVSARKGSRSYHNDLQRMFRQLYDRYPSCSKMLIYPDQYGVESHWAAFNTGFPNRVN